MADELATSYGVWLSTSIFLFGLIVGAIPFIVRGDFFGRKYADEAEARLSEELDEAERRMNERIDREVAAITAEMRKDREALGREIKEIKDTLARIWDRIK